ncbi:hypothetical protein [Desertivirga xinjiangensis]|uniref:hypothetical protein n=1 Tax=Desertivirga xinjiangensis TaxID=539206 RepID=UPI00210E756E|nr:hypothetical protein [Pedobacter xinjiangensis]
MGMIWTTKNIDYARSSIVKAGIGMTKIDQLNIQSASDPKEAIRAMKPPEGVWIEKLVLRDDVKDDIFFLDRVDGSNYYISERLKDEIIGAGCTGIVFVNYTEKYPG